MGDLLGDKFLLPKLERVAKAFEAYTLIAPCRTGVLIETLVYLQRAAFHSVQVDMFF